MKSKIFSLFICLLLMLSFIDSDFALVKSYHENDISDIKKSIIDFNLSKSDSTDITTWIESEIPKDIGGASEWYVLSLSQSGKYDFSKYKNELYSFFNSHTISSASSNLKFALLLATVGGEREDIERMLNESMGKQGIMSYVYGLHLLNNGFSHAHYSVETALDEILNRQLADGGWAVSGNVSNVDVTSMVIQALSSSYNIPKVKLGVDIALEYLSKIQLSDGDFVSYGLSNPESGAQLIVALSSLGIDFLKDERFIKNENTVLDGILKYRLSDGSFSHSLNTPSNSNSTVQVFYSMVAYERMKEGKKGLYILDSCLSFDESTDESINHDEISLTSTSADAEYINSEASSSTSSAESKTFGVKIRLKYKIMIFILIIGSFSIFVLFLLKKINKNNIVTILVITSILLLICFFLDIKTKDEFYSDEGISKNNPLGTVTMSINCNVLLDKNDEMSLIPKDGIILTDTEFVISEGESVYDVLIEASKKYSIIIDNNGVGDSAYIAGINNIYEFDYGDLSGWVYYVNGKQSPVGCSSYILQDGDIVEWEYTLSLGSFD